MATHALVKIRGSEKQAELNEWMWERGPRKEDERKGGVRETGEGGGEEADLITWG